jgi:small-conductance mechanosensitive channel
MLGVTEICILAAAALLLVCATVPRLRPYRSLFLGAALLAAITALFPRTGNPLGHFLFEGPSGATRLPRELFGVAWWILGAWLLKSLLDLVLSRTVFPDNGEPHARRLFADLASALIYVLAFVGVVDTVLKQPVSSFLATSGVLAIVLGLALQNTLADVFAGLAINIERPFGAGDWISLPDRVSGQVIEVNWRATRLRTLTNDTIVMPNSVVAKAIVTNHSRPIGLHFRTLRLDVEHTVAPARVLEALQAAATGSPGTAPATVATARACEFSDSLIGYELAFAIDDFALAPGIQSEVVRRIGNIFQERGIAIGASATDVRIVPTVACPSTTLPDNANEGPPRQESGQRPVR